MAKNKPADITKTGPLNWRTLQEQNNPTSNVDQEVLSALIGNVPIITQHDLDANSPHGIQTPLYNPESGDYFGNSAFDKDYLTEDDLYKMRGNPNELRAEAQPWFSKLVNGIGKAGVLAATTAAELGGLIYGLGQGAYNAATFDEDNGTEGEGSRAGAFLHGLWDNPITQTLQKINEASEEYMPNYYTQDELQNPFGNIFTANFLGDKIIKNLGFMVGAFYGGIPVAKGLSKIGTKLVSGAREAKAAEELGMQAAVNDINAAAKSAEAADKLLDVRHLTQAERGIKAREGLESINRIANNTRATTQVVGSLGSAINEGAIEAINNSKDWAEMKTREENDRYQKELEDIYYNYGDSPEAESAQLLAEEEHQKQLANIQRGRATMGNADLLMNIPILTYSNFIQLGKLYTRGFETNRRRLGSIWNRHKLPGEAAEGTMKSSKGKWGGVGRGLRNSAMEGTEEYLQRSASDASGEVVMDSINRYFNSGNSEEAKTELDDYIVGFAKAVADNAGNPQAWEEFMIGALSSTVGMPVFGSQTKNAYMKLGPVGFAGGFKGAMDEYKAERDHEKEVADYLNKRVKEESFQKLYNYLKRSSDYEKALEEAIINKDKEEYLNLEAEKFFEDINYFASSGHLEEFKQLVQFNEEYDDAELEDIVKNTRRPVTAAELKKRDEDRVADIDKRLSQIEDPNAIQKQLDEVNSNISQCDESIRQINEALKTDMSKDEKAALTQNLEQFQHIKEGLLSDRQDLMEIQDKVEENAKRKEALTEEKNALLEKMADDTNYKDTDEGEFVKVIDGTVYGMNVLPDVDEEGNPIKGTEGNEMRRILDKNRKRILKGINDYLRIRDYIDVESDGRLKDSDINLLTRMRMQILNQEDRSTEMAVDLAQGLRHLLDKYNRDNERISTAYSTAKKYYNKAAKKLEEAKEEGKSPEEIAELEADVVANEHTLNMATQRAFESKGVTGILELLSGYRDTTQKEKEALDRGYGRDESGNTYSDLHDNSKRTVTSDEAQAVLAHEDNVKLFEALVAGDPTLTDLEKEKYISELWSLHHLANNRNAYLKKFREFIGDPSLINEAAVSEKDRMTEAQKDNISDKLSLRMRRARDMSELDSIIRNAQVDPEIVESALKKARQDGDDEFKSRLNDYEETKKMYQAINEKLGASDGLIQGQVKTSLNTAWEEAMMDGEDDPEGQSKLDKFLNVLNEYVDGYRKAGHTAQADLLENALKDLKVAATSTSTSSSSTVRTASTGGVSAGAAAAAGTGGEKGITRDKAISNVKAVLESHFIDKKKPLAPMNDWEALGVGSAYLSNIRKYNDKAEKKDKIDDDVIKLLYDGMLEERGKDSKIDELQADASMSNDSNAVGNDDLVSQKSADMKNRIRVTFQGIGVTLYQIFKPAMEGTKYQEGRFDYEPHSDKEKAVQKILKDTGAYDFIGYNFLGYLQNSDPENPIKVRFVKPNNSDVEDTVFVAIEWSNDVAARIKETGFGRKSDVTVLAKPIVVSDGKETKEYQIIGDLSILEDDPTMDAAIADAFKEVRKAANSKAAEIFEDDAYKALNDQGVWADCGIESSIDTIYTGRMALMDADHLVPSSTVPISGMISQSNEWKGEDDIVYGVISSVGGSNKLDLSTDDPLVEVPNNVWMQRADSRGAILLFLRKADGRLYPLRCVRRTVGEWLGDNGEALVKQALENKKEANAFVKGLVNTLKNLLNPESKDLARVQAKNALGKYLILATKSGDKAIPIKIGFDGDTVKITFSSAEGDSKTIKVEDGKEEKVNEAVMEFLQIIAGKGIVFTVPLPSNDSELSGKDLVSADIFKSGVKEFYNFNPSFTIAPVDVNSEPIDAAVPEEARAKLGSTKMRPNGYNFDIGDGLYLYTSDPDTGIFYRHKLDKNNNPTGVIERVADDKQTFVSNVFALIQAKQDSDVMHNALMDAALNEDYKVQKVAVKNNEDVKNSLKSSFSHILVLNVDGETWFYDSSIVSHDKSRLIKAGSKEGKAIIESYRDTVVRLVRDLPDSGLSKGGEAASDSTIGGLLDQLVKKLEGRTAAGGKKFTKDKARKIQAEIEKITSDDDLEPKIRQIFKEAGFEYLWNNFDGAVGYTKMYIAVQQHIKDTVWPKNGKSDSAIKGLKGKGDAGSGTPAAEAKGSGRYPEKKDDLPPSDLRGALCKGELSIGGDRYDSLEKSIDQLYDAIRVADMTGGLSSEKGPEVKMTDSELMDRLNEIKNTSKSIKKQEKIDALISDLSCN